MSAALSLWTVYANPTDHPDLIVARRWEVGSGPEPVPTEDAFMGKTVEMVVRELEALGLTPLGRADSDDDRILGTWV